VHGSDISWDFDFFVIQLPYSEQDNHNVTVVTFGMRIKSILRHIIIKAWLLIWLLKQTNNNLFFGNGRIQRHPFVKKRTESRRDLSVW